MLTVEIDTSSITAALNSAPGQLRYATQQGINKTAFDVRDEVKIKMTGIFDRPTPYTINSLKVFQANKSNLTAEINFKGKPSDHYLNPEVFGGARQQKIFEKQLESKTISKFLIPGTKQSRGGGPQLDGYGNVSGGNILRILTILGVSRNETQNRTEKSAKRKIRTLNGYKEFVVINGNIYERVPQNGKALSAKTRKGLAPGVYQKGANGEITKATGLKLWFFAAKKAPTYKPIFQYHKISKDIIDKQLSINIKKGIAMAFNRNNK